VNVLNVQTLSIYFCCLKEREGHVSTSQQVPQYLSWTRIAKPCLQFLRVDQRDVGESEQCGSKAEHEN